LCYSPGMQRDVEVRLGPGDRERLEAVVPDRNRAQKHVWRAQIILATAAGCGTAEIMRRAGVSKPCVWRWQRRFMEAGVDALLHDKTRKPGKAPVPEPIVAQLVERTVGAPPGETTHWTSRAMADVMGLAISTEFCCRRGSLNQNNPEPRVYNYRAGGCGAIRRYTGFSGPASFGSGGQTLASSGSGDIGIDDVDNFLLLPSGYSSGASLSSSATWDSTTFSMLGVTPGTYVWMWEAPGVAADNSFTLIIPAAAVPEPASRTLLGAELTGLAFLRRRRRAAVAVKMSCAVRPPTAAPADPRAPEMPHR
jgi:transposase